MIFKQIDLSTWDRKEYFEYYLKQVACTYSMTLNLDLTFLMKEIKSKGIKLYPTMIYLLSMVVNRHEEFRMSIDAQGNVGVFDLLYPSYTVLQSDQKTFTNIWTEYTSSFAKFYKKYLQDIQDYSEIKRFIAKPNMPTHVFNISSFPWISFTSFNLMIKDTKYLLPIFTLGKYFEENGKLWMPIAIQVHHAVCDGIHLARFIEELQKIMNEPLQNK